MHSFFSDEGAMMVDSGVTLREGVYELDIFDQECSQMFLNLYQHCVDWRLIGLHLYLTKADIAAVDEDNWTADERRIRMLRQWKEKFASKAMYKVFIEASWLMEEQRMLWMPVK